MLQAFQRQSCNTLSRVLRLSSTLPANVSIFFPVTQFIPSTPCSLTSPGHIMPSASSHIPHFLVLISFHLIKKTKLLAPICELIGQKTHCCLHKLVWVSLFYQTTYFPKLENNFAFCDPTPNMSEPHQEFKTPLVPRWQEQDADRQSSPRWLASSERKAEKSG